MTGIEREPDGAETAWVRDMGQGKATPGRQEGRAGRPPEGRGASVDADRGAGGRIEGGGRAGHPEGLGVRIWGTAFLAQRCGRCGGDIAKGAPIFRLHLAGVKTPKVRCRTCAGEPVPDAMPPPPVPLVTGVLRRLGFLPLDEREPGSDG